MTSFTMVRGSMVAVILAAIVGCSPGATSTLRPGTTGVPQSIPGVTPTGGPSGAGGLCYAFPELLAVAALGVPVATPTGGDVVPRPNGIYCHYAAAADANVNVDAQLKDMTREEFDALAVTYGMTETLPAVGDAAYELRRSLMGGAGATVLAWQDGRAVTVLMNRDGDASEMVASAAAIAVAVLINA